MSVYKFKYKLPDQNQVEGHIVIKGDKGDKGEKGDRGEKGEKGDRGETGFGAFVYEKVAQLPSHGEPSKLYLIEKPHTLATATGNPIEINVANEDAVEDAKMLGDTEQQTYTGKNLCGGTLAQIKNRNSAGTWNGNSYTQAGITWTVYENADGTIDRIEASGQATENGKTFYIESFNRQQFEEQLRSEETYTLSGCPQGGSSGYYVRVASIPWKSMLTDRGSAATGTLIPSDNYNSVFIILGIDTSAGQVNNLVFRPQLELGSTATSYEPYVGGQPSPNPEYPQDIKVVTGKQTVKVVGKNLFVPPESSTSRGVTFTKNSDGSFNISGKAEGGEALCSIFTDINLQDGDSVTLSSNVSRSTGVAYRVEAYDGNTWLKSLIAQTSAMPTTVAIPQNATRLRYSIGVLSGREVNLTNVTFQLEKGSTATTFEPYREKVIEVDLGDIELCKLGNYQDYIYKDGNDWKAHKEIGKVTLDGSESWTKASANSGYRFWTSKAADIKTSIDAVLKANRLGVAQGDTWEYEGISGSYSTNPMRLYIRDALFGDMTVEQLLGWLATHNIIAYYALATPTDTTITNTSLIAELEELDEITMERGLNTITVTSVDPNLAADLELTYDIYDSEERFDKFIWFDGWERI